MSIWGIIFTIIFILWMSIVVFILWRIWLTVAKALADTALKSAETARESAETVRRLADVLKETKGGHQ